MEVTRGLLDQLLAEARDAYPHECCGLLLGLEDTVTAVQPARNIHPAPLTNFELDPQTLISAHRAARSGGPQVIGHYHSHPNGLARPSKTDEAMRTGQGMIWAIVANGTVTFWRESEGGFTALPYRVVPR